MTEKTTKPQEEQPKENFDPIARAVSDAIDTGFFSDNKFNMPKLCDILRKRGLVGAELWNQKALSAPLTLFEQASRDMDENETDALLNNFAATIIFDATLTKRHFYAIRQGWEEQFLKSVEPVDLFPDEKESS
jgi:hypothetical protein